MILKGVCGIVGGADDLYARAANEISCTVLGLCKKFVALLPNARSGLLGKRLINVKVSLELKVSPVIQR